MNMVRQYRTGKGLTQIQLAEELNAALGETYDKALISYMERDKLRPSEKVECYIRSQMPLQGVELDSDARKGEAWTTLPQDKKKSLKSAILKNWNSRGLTQNQRVIAYIEEFGSITSKEAFDMMGVTRLASRIHDLSEMGYVFRKQTESAENRYGDKTKFIRYSLIGDGDGKSDMGGQ